MSFGSWISNLFGGGGDDKALLYQQQQDAQRRQDALDATAKEDKRVADEKAANIAKRTQGVNTARTSAGSYLQSLGLDPTQFSGDIDSKINEALSYTADDDPNVGQYLGDLGKTIYDTRTNADRMKAGRGIDLAFGPDYANSRIQDTLDDPILGGIEQKQRGSADEYINNLMKRGVITQSGQAAAEHNLDDQSSRVRTILNELGKTSLDAGRQGLNDIANRGRSAASTLTLGNAFDPNQYTSEADKSYNDFIGSLGDSINSKVSGQLFDTSKLANIAGAAQGAGNFKFDPNALAGGVGIPPGSNPDSEEDPTKQPRITF